MQINQNSGINNIKYHTLSANDFIDPYYLSQKPNLKNSRISNIIATRRDTKIVRIKKSLFDNFVKKPLPHDKWTRRAIENMFCKILPSLLESTQK